MIGMTVCSGIGAPEVSAPWIDWRYQSEIEPFPCAVLAHQFPDAVNLGDMTKFQEWPDATVDVLCGGTPCQSFSVAGLRKGLDDPRGNLMLTYLAIARRYRPRWVVWENVAGVLSSNGGRDFGCFLGGLGELGYGFAYRVLDAQYTRTRDFPRAVPQRRRRVFVVGYLGDWRRAAAVLFDGESLSGNPPPRRETREAAPTIPSRSTGGGGLGTDFDCDGGLIPTGVQPVASTLNAAFGSKLGLEDQHINSGAPLFIPHCAPTTANALRAEGHDASEDGTGRQTLIAAIQERAVSENPDAGPDGAGVRTDGAAYTLEARAVSQAVAFQSRASASNSMNPSEVAPTLDKGKAEGMAVAFDPNQITSKTNRSQPDPAVHHTLPAASSPPMLATPWAVRRLTPTECERLMGFSDGHTSITYRGKPAADGPRYKALGNSWAVNCGQWIFDRIKMVEARP